MEQGLSKSSLAFEGSAQNQILYGVTETDPVTFGGAAVALGLVALVATYLPVRHAVSP